MAYDLRKYKFKPASSRPARPDASSESSAEDNNTQTEPSMPTPGESLAMDNMALKADIIASLRSDISTVIRQELKSALADDFEKLRKEMKEIKAEITNGNSAFHAELDTVKSTIKDVEGGLSMWSDEVTILQDTVSLLEKQVDLMNTKCLDMESRMRRGNVRICNVEEQPDSSSPKAVSKLLKEVFQLGGDVRVDRSHRSLTKKKPGDKPRMIIAKLHNEGDAEDILRMARDGRRLHYNGKTISVFPDYPASIAKARGAFTAVRLLLKDRRDVRYGIKHPATFVLTHNNVEKKFLDATEAMDYAKSIVNTTGAAAAPPPDLAVAEDQNPASVQDAEA